MRAFSTALDAIPLALAENSGLSPIEALADIKSRQAVEGNARLGVDCAGRGENGTPFFLFIFPTLPPLYLLKKLTLPDSSDTQT
jgi:hypothetical protein